MSPPYKPHIPESVSEIMEVLAFMTLYSPKFVDKTGYFPEQNIDTVFLQLNEGVRVNRGKLGEELYRKLVEMSDRMRVHFEADSKNKTDETLKGRAIIHEMEVMLKQNARKS
jgi:hypothetical protein